MLGATDEEIIAEKENQINGLDEEQRKTYYTNEYEEDKRICRKLSEQLKARIEPIEGDIHHIKVDGRVLGYNGFEEWKQKRLDQLETGELPKPQLGFFTE